MIFVTVGTSSYQFDRLLKIVDELCKEGILDKNEVFAQTGECKYNPINYKYSKVLDYKEHQECIQKSEYIITHSGTGSIISALKKGVKVIAIPRLEKYGEHVDDHQIELANAFEKKGYILKANNKEELKTNIKNIKCFNANKFVSNSDSINNIIEDFIINNKV